MILPLTVAAKNEEQSLGPCLDALLIAVRYAAKQGIAFDLRVVLDDCTDDTEAVARARGVRTLRASGGKVEAQREGLREGLPAGSPDPPIGVFVDAKDRVWVSSLNDRVQGFTADGTFLLKLEGNGTKDDKFLHPHGMAQDSAGHFYVADAGHQRIVKFAMGK